MAQCVFLKIGALTVGIVLILFMPSSIVFEEARDYIRVLAELGRVEITTADAITNIAPRIPEMASSGRFKRSVSSLREPLIILNFTLDNIRQLMNQVGGIRDKETLNWQLRIVQDELDGPASEVISSSIPSLIDYHENKVKSSLASFHRYLNNPDRQGYKKNFSEEAATLPAALQDLVDDLTGSPSSNLNRKDILVELRNNLQCHGPRMQESIDYIMKIVVAGCWMYAEYQRMKNPFGPLRSPFNASFKPSQLLERLEDVVLKCREDEQKISEEMLREIIDAGKMNLDRQQIAKRILDKFKEKYDTKTWIIVVLSKVTNRRKIESVQSRRFHTATDNRTLALAISSVSRTDAPEFYQRKNRLFDSHFKFPFNTNDPSSPSRSPENAFQIFEYLNRHLTPLRANSQFHLETLVIKTPDCATSEKDMMESFVTILTSDGLGKVHLTNDGSCVRNLAMVVPVRVSISNNDSLSSAPTVTSTLSRSGARPSTSCLDTRADPQGGVLLRNEVLQSYLAMENPSNNKTYAVLDEKRGNGDGQKWRFVNDTLMSSDDKCLIVRDNGDLSDALVETCDAYNGKEKKWIRHGLQIVNGFNKCLSFKNKRLVQADCRLSPDFLWYDWDVNCEDAVMTPLTNMDNKSRPLRNEFSKRYLSLDENGVWVTNEPWGNRPNQYWRFVNGQLLNQNDNCLTKCSKKFLVEKCVSENSGQKWSFNQETHQIVDAGGANCLGISKISGDTPLIHSPCYGELDQRWRFVETPLSTTVQSLPDAKNYGGTMRLTSISHSEKSLLHFLFQKKYSMLGKWVEAGVFNNESVFQQSALDRNQLRSQVDWFEKHLLAGLNNNLQRDLKTLNAVAKNIIENNQNKVVKCLSNLRKYLEDLDNSSSLQYDFFNEAATLMETLNALIAGFLGKSDLDVLASIRDSVNCYRSKLEKHMNGILSVVMVGLWVHVTYQRMKYISDRTAFDPSKFIESSEMLLNRLTQQMLLCQDTRNVSREMQTVMTEESQDRKGIADALLRFLEEKYETKKWLVIVSSHRGMDRDLSGGFHTANVNGFFAAAISADRTDLQGLSNLASSLLNRFKFPIKTTKSFMRVSLEPKDRAHDIHQQFSKFLAPLWTNGRLGIESFVFVTPCGKKTGDYVTIVASNNFQWKTISNQDECANKKLIVVPISSAVEKPDHNKPNPSTSVRHCHDKMVNAKPVHNFLRNDVAKGYLSVQEKSIAKDNYIIVDPEWRNVTGQRWFFDEKSLKNENGKCLTAWDANKWFLYLDDCHPDWPGQTWIRHGLQIVNGYRFCLAIDNVKYKGITYVIQYDCDSTPQFLWYDWDVDCKEAIVSSQEKNSSQPLRN